MNPASKSNGGSAPLVQPVTMPVEVKVGGNTITNQVLILTSQPVTQLSWPPEQAVQIGLMLIQAAEGLRARATLPDGQERKVWSPDGPGGQG